MRGLFLAFVGTLLLGCGEERIDIDNDSCPSKPVDTSAARVFVIQPRIAPEHFVTYEAYRNHLVELTRINVSKCLAQDRPNVIVFPENTGLPAAFIGSRGQAARESTSAFAAFLALGGQYVKPVEFYKNKWPNVPLPNQIELGITDTVWRAFFETNQFIATELGAWVVGSANVSGQVEKSTDPVEIAALADPDIIDVSYVYVARESGVYNTTYVHAPDGSIVAARRKPYLVAAEQTDLALTPGAVRDALPVDIGPLSLGIFTSKDAWMPDMVDRLAVLGADTFVQTEAFSGWTIPENPSEPNVWAPDILSQSAMAAVRKHGAYRNGVVSHLTGNLFDMTFDGQSIIIGDPIPGQIAPGYVGQPDDGGVLAVARWVSSDPIEEDPSATLDVRRAKLRTTGLSLLPGGSRANQYIETAIAADVGAPLPITSNGAAGILGASRALSNVGQAEQSFPAVAWTNTSPIVVAFQEGSRGATRIVVVTSEDQGKTFGPPHPVSNTKNSVQATPHRGSFRDIRVRRLARTQLRRSPYRLRHIE
jgi:predicted amidohydrolase